MVAAQVNSLSAKSALKELIRLLSPKLGLHREATAALISMGPLLVNELSAEYDRLGYFQIPLSIVITIVSSMEEPPRVAVEAVKGVLTQVSKGRSVDVVTIEQALRLAVYFSEYDSIIPVLPELFSMQLRSSSEYIATFLAHPRVFGMLIRRISQAWYPDSSENSSIGTQEAQRILKFILLAISVLRDSEDAAETSDIEAATRISLPPRTTSSHVDWGSAYGTERYEEERWKNNGLRIPELRALATAALDRRRYLRE